ncbi:hypothetical protein [uncultured Thiobacillus sp.]|uniref:hypothetical protein n=1 Tax=uncultured Thiobacillus sp. TaxID=189996 RepID=UPI00260603C0|nr:hypothetical protein [uncultured Thiobacillus sp.]
MHFVQSGLAQRLNHAQPCFALKDLPTALSVWLLAIRLPNHKLLLQKANDPSGIASDLGVLNPSIKKFSRVIQPSLNFSLVSLIQEAKEASPEFLVHCALLKKREHAP